VELTVQPESDLLPSKIRGLRWVRPMLVSVPLVIPCFWQPIVSGLDLQSHLYNAWLIELIQRGSIHGVWIGNQSTNVLVDWFLPQLIKCFGVSGAERAASTALVLIFFWGAFQFISAVPGHAVYWLTPWLAILSYGFVFQVGLLNYYLSSGIVLWLLAILWKRQFKWRALWASPLLVLAYLAHFLPVLWFVGIAVYCGLALRMRARLRLLLFCACVTAFFLLRGYVVGRYITSWSLTQLKACTGVDQSLLYGWRYLPVAIGFLIFSGILLLKPENRWRAMISVPAQAFLLTAVAIAVMPSGIRASMDKAPATFIAQRLSLFSGVLLLAILSRSAYRRWYLPAGLLTAAIFFGALYRDIGKEARVEAKMQDLVATLPAGERVVSFLDLKDRELSGKVSTGDGLLVHWAKRFVPLSSERLPSTHLLSRACVGHCFDYLNYEPSTGQFRIHAAPGNNVVLATYAEYYSMNAETYTMNARDLPLYALIRCGPDPSDLLMRPMAEGESGAMLGCSGSPVPR